MKELELNTKIHPIYKKIHYINVNAKLWNDLISYHSKYPFESALEVYQIRRNVEVDCGIRYKNLV